MSTSFSTKCEILTEVYQEAHWNEELQDFRAFNDIGLPLAFFINNEICNPTDEGKKYVEETWQKLCEALKIDPNKEYKDSDDVLTESGIDLDDEDEDD